MKNKKTLSLLVGTAMLANVILFSVVAAAEVTISQQKLIAGQLEIVSVPASQNFVDLTVSNVDQTQTTWFAGAVQFRDQRALVTPSAWNLTATAYPFRNSSDPAASTFDYSQFSIASDVADEIENVTTSDDCNGNIDIPVAQETFTAFSGTGAVSNAINLATAASVSYVDECKMNPELQLTVPANTTAGTWVTTLTFSIG